MGDTDVDEHRRPQTDDAVDAPVANADEPEREPPCRRARQRDRDPRGVDLQTRWNGASDRMASGGHGPLRVRFVPDRSHLRLRMEFVPKVPRQRYRLTATTNIVIDDKKPGGRRGRLTAGLALAPSLCPRASPPSSA